MTKFQHDVMLKTVKVLDMMMVELPFALCWFMYYSNIIYAKFSWKGNFAILGLFAVLFVLLGKVYDAFWMSPFGSRPCKYNSDLREKDDAGL